MTARRSSAARDSVVDDRRRGWGARRLRRRRRAGHLARMTATADPVRLHRQHLPQPDGPGTLPAWRSPLGSAAPPMTWSIKATSSPPPAWPQATGHRAADEAVAVVQDRGGSLHNHSSRQLSPAMIAVGRPRHRDDPRPSSTPSSTSTRAWRTASASSIPGGATSPTPIGCDRATYIRTADAIEAHLRVLPRRNSP